MNFEILIQNNVGANQLLFNLDCAVNNQCHLATTGKLKVNKTTTARYYKKETFLHSPANANIGYFSPFA